MNKIIFLAFAVASLAGFMSCHSHNGHSHDEEAPAAEPAAVTLFTKNVELFAEYNPFVAGQESAFAAHLNDLVNFRPFPSGSLTVILQNEKNKYENRVDAPSVPGIYRPVLTPKEPGIYRLTFLFDNEAIKDTITVESVEVYTSVNEIPAGPDHDGDEIVYLKEQAWKTSFATVEVIESPFYSVIKTSARVKSQPTKEVVLSSQVAGQVTLLKVTGEKVRKGDIIAAVSGGSLENNLSVRLNEARIAYEKSRADFERTKPLAENQVISRKDYLEIVTKYRQDSVRYNQFAENVTGNTLKIISPVDGILSDIMVSNGGFIETGSPVARIMNNNDLLIEAFINQSDHRLVSSIFDANFREPSGNRTFTLASVNGSVRSANAFVGENSLRIPVNFTVTNDGELMPGMFLEAYVKANPKGKALVVPYSALSEEQGRFYVYIQKGGESFIKKEVTPGGYDGLFAEVISGLVPGDRVVTKGVQQIRLSSMAGGLPLHGHTH